MFHETSLSRHFENIEYSQRIKFLVSQLIPRFIF
jgi:hypothetical protein